MKMNSQSTSTNGRNTVITGAMVQMVKLVLIIASVVIVAGETYVGSLGRSGPATIVSGNSWTGGDLQYYFNATISFQGQNHTVLFTCDYYHVGQTVEVLYNPNVPSFQVMDEAPGCNPT